MNLKLCVFGLITMRTCVQQMRQLQQQLDRLYQQSMNALQSHRTAIEEPVQQCLKIFRGQISTIERVTHDLKSMLTQSDSLPQLPRALREAQTVLSASAGLQEMAIPRLEVVCSSDLPPSKLKGLALIQQTDKQQDCVDRARCSCPAGCRCDYSNTCYASVCWCNRC